jgi:predicted AlkP superfamily phosphohydrolase/phosphomutase
VRSKRFKRPDGETAEDARFELMLDLAGRLKPHEQRKIVAYESTRAFNMRDFHKDVQGIYLNLAGRDPKGVIPEDKFASARKKLIKELKALRTEQGAHLFTEVSMNEQKGIRPMGMADEPDIFVRLNREALLHEFAYRSYEDPDPIPLAAIRWIYSDVSALPEPGGVFIVSGPRAPSFQNLDSSALDITPTILWVLGLPIGNNMLGRHLREPFVPLVANKEPLYIDSWRK